MTKKDIEEAIVELDREKVSHVYVLYLWFLLVALIIVLVCSLATSIPQGTWECVEWEEVNVIKEYNTIIHTCKFKTMDDFDEDGINECHESLDELLERKLEFQILAKQIGEPPEPRKVCIKEQLIREVSI